MDQHKLEQYRDPEGPRPGPIGDHREVMEMFANIVAGRATPRERERYLAAWFQATPQPDTVLAAY
jgi:hypothetical protein